MQFNTLKRRDDLLLFKNGCTPPSFVTRDKRGNQSVSQWKGFSDDNNPRQIGGFSWMLI